MQTCLLFSLKPNILPIIPHSITICLLRWLHLAVHSPTISAGLLRLLLVHIRPSPLLVRHCWLLIWIVRTPGTVATHPPCIALVWRPRIPRITLLLLLLRSLLLRLVLIRTERVKTSLQIPLDAKPNGPRSINLLLMKDNGNQSVGVVVLHIAICAGGLGFDSRVGQLLAYSSPPLRRWASPLAAHFGLILRV